MKQATLIKLLAPALVAIGCENTTQANWVFDFDEIEDMFELKPGTIEKIINKIDEEIVNYAYTVAETEIDYNEKTYSLTFYTEYCGCNYTLEEE